MRSLIILASALMLGACQSNFYHHEPESADATLIFSSNNQAVQSMVCVPGQGFKDTRYAVGRGGFSLLDDLSEALGKRSEVTIVVAPADPTVVAFRFRQGGRAGEKSRCRVAAAFTTQAEEAYQVRFIRESSNCNILVTQVMENGEAITVDNVSYDTPQNLACH